MKESERKCFKCGASPGEDPDTTLYRFPKPSGMNEERCQKWAKYCCPDKEWLSVGLHRKLYSEHRMLCHRHFDRMEFVDYDGKKLLRNACPDVELENDAENYLKYRLVGGRLTLKKGVVPHLFDCQTEEDMPEKESKEIESLEPLLGEDGKEVDFVVCGNTENPREPQFLPEDTDDDEGSTGQNHIKKDTPSKRNSENDIQDESKTVMKYPVNPLTVLKQCHGSNTPLPTRKRTSKLESNASPKRIRMKTTPASLPTRKRMSKLESNGSPKRRLRSNTTLESSKTDEEDLEFKQRHKGIQASPKRRVRLKTAPDENNTEEEDTVCRACLKIDCRLYKMEENGTLWTMFQDVTGLVVRAGGLPRSLCGGCAGWLRACALFRSSSCRAHAQMQRLLRLHAHITADSVRSMKKSCSPSSLKEKKYTKRKLNDTQTDEAEMYASDNSEDIVVIKVEGDRDSPDIDDEYIDYKERNDNDKTGIGTDDDNDKTGIGTDDDDNDKTGIGTDDNNDKTGIGTDDDDNDKTGIGTDDDDDDNDKTEIGTDDDDNDKTEIGTDDGTMKIVIVRDMDDVKFEQDEDGAEVSNDEDMEYGTDFADADDSKDETYSEEAKPRSKNKPQKQKKRRIRKPPSNKMFCCTLCPFESKISARIMAHMNAHKSPRSIQCEKCFYVTADRRLFEIHMRRHLKGLVHSCDYCIEKFPTLSKLMEHVREHIRVSPYTCDMCGMKFNNKSHFRYHVVRHTRYHQCNICGERFEKKRSLFKHMAVHGDEARIYECSVCGKTFYCPNILKRHVYTHRGEKPFSCDVCGLKLVSKTSLKQHRFIHTGEKPYTCPVCGKSFRQAGTLKDHERMHFRERV